MIKSLLTSYGALKLLPICVCILTANWSNLSFSLWEFYIEAQRPRNWGQY